MAGEFDRLERAVEQDMRLLGDLPEIAPSAGCLERLRAAVGVEAARATRRRRQLVLLRAWGGVAAAVLFAVALASSVRTQRVTTPADPEAVLADWTTAVEESTQRIAGLLDNGWIHGDFGVDEDASDVDDLLRSLEQSFSEFESLDSG